MTNPTRTSVQLPSIGAVPITFTQTGTGHPVLLLHGGGGPQTVLGWADQLAAQHPVRVLTPVHPGWNGTQRPDGLSTIRQLAELYAAWLAELDLTGVTVVGNSIGGWIAAELATLDSPRVSRVVLVDAVGLDVPGHPVAAPTSPRELAELAYHDPDRFGVDPSRLSAEARASMAANQQVLRHYAGTTMTDPTLPDRLGQVNTPTLVVWGDSDRISDLEVGRAYADAIPGARFELLPEAGHLPQIEAPAALTGVVWPFIDADVLAG